MKLTELRAKTDRQLVQLINSRLNAGLVFLRWAAESEDCGRWTSRDIFRDSASRAYNEALKLFPWVAADAPQCMELDLKFAQFRRALAALSAEPIHLLRTA